MYRTLSLLAVLVVSPPCFGQSKSSAAASTTPGAKAASAVTADTRLGSGAAPAAPAPEDPSQRAAQISEPSDDARRLFELAARAFAEGRNADAIVLFRRANKLTPNPRFYYNIGLAYEDMGDNARALDAYRLYLREETAQDDRQATLDRVAELQKSLVKLGIQQLIVTTDPPGVMLSVDGQPVGVTPWTGELELGAHDLALSHEGLQTQTIDVWLSEEDASEVSLAMAPPPPPSVTAPEPLPPPEQPPWFMKIQPATWTLAAAGTAAIGGGIVFEMLRASDEKRAGTLTGMEADSASRSANVKQAASLTLFGTGVALWVASGVMAGFDLSRHEEQPLAKPRPVVQSVAGAFGPDFTGVQASGTF